MKRNINEYILDKSLNTFFLFSLQDELYKMTILTLILFSALDSLHKLF